MHRFPFFALLIFFWASGNISAQTPTFLFSIDADSDPALGGFGLGFSGDGTTLAISSPKVLPPGSSEVGKVQVYEITSSGYNQIGQDLFGTGLGGDFGYHLDLNSDGTIIAISAPDVDNDNFFLTGEIKVFMLNQANTWQQIGQTIEGESNLEFMGRDFELSADGLTLIVGASSHNATFNDQGKVRVYEYSEGTWVLKGQALFGEQASDFFGSSVEISEDGNSIIVTSTGYDGDSEDNIGIVRFYTYDGSQWVEDSPPITGEAAGYNFGLATSLSANNEHLAVSGIISGNNSQNYISVFTKIDGFWTKIGSDIYDETEEDRVARWFKIDETGETIYNGLSRVDTQVGTDVGELRIYDFSNEEWTKRTPSIFGESDRELFGANVQLSPENGLIAVSATRHENSQGGEGQTRVFSTSTVLPVEFTYVNAKESIDKRSILLEWQIRQSDDIDFFEIEFIEDRGNWERIGYIPNSEIRRDQTHFSLECPLDQQISNSLIIRIKASEYDNTVSYSSPISITISPNFSVFPNPTSSDFISINAPTINNGMLHLLIKDLLGHTLIHKTISSSANSINVSELKAGTYTVLLKKENNELIHSSFLIKQ